MGNKVTDELLSTVRSIVGCDFSDMDIIRALHLAKYDPTAAVNIIFDTPNFNSKFKPQISKTPNPSTKSKPKHAPEKPKLVDKENGNRNLGDNLAVSCSGSTEGEGEGEGEGDVNGENLSLSDSAGSEWWYVGSGVVAGLSTCKGRKVFGKGRQAAASCSEIVRFSTRDGGEVGRIPNEWARSLLPLVRDKKVRVEGCCKSAPDVLGIMDTILLSISVYIDSAMFRKHQKTSLKAASHSNEETIIHPLPNLFRLLGLTPFKKAEFTPADLYTKKRPLNLKDGSGIPVSLLHVNNSKNQSKNGNEVENEESISDADLDNIVGVGNCSELEEMDPPTTLQCELRPYQKQALYWMIQLEKGKCAEEGATTLHPCWEAYHLADKRELVVYLNTFSGDATVEFPSMLQMARGGILADAMGLGKTIMTIALLLAQSERDRSSSSRSVSHLPNEDGDIGDILVSPNPLKKFKKFSGFDKLMKQKKILADGGNLIICPMTLLGQWKAEIETHAQPGSLSIYVHYGQSRTKDTKLLAQNDVVITTYGVLASEFSAENNVEDIYSLLRFLKVEPWESWAWWNKLVQKPFEEGDERGLKLIQSILKPIMLRRTKSSTDREGRPILVLPPAEIQVIYCELTEAERDFYEALFKRSKVKFDQFVEQGRVLHNYASILELLLRLRQCCDHPFLVMRKTITRQELITAPTDSRFQIDIEKNWVESSKVNVLLQELENLHSSGSKSILFSQWTAFWISYKFLFLDGPRFLVLAIHYVDINVVLIMVRSSIPFVRLDGTLNQQQRERVIKQFSEDDNILALESWVYHLSGGSVQVLLMSLKAGGVGINLTAASNAFVMDPWWNPAVEEQAVMRIHRIGQTKQVRIKRFIVKGTVEERMEAVQARKQRMISGALTDQEVRNARIEELKMLFT
ncbi:hypothetical protein GH714_015032 [Hevea brasiliensis]|uniref:Helicase C-terminal domain-containing protein n=1 Tax=Hevea brasiliensis TaxID=3981 RepID=A0A6A6LGV7_HEVBR|nr:hypothetical protein GH714_015032 [Hevea brasiliensis]